MYPRYNLVTSDTLKFLLNAQKMSMVGSAHYVITMEQQNMTRQTAGYLGKVRAGNSANEFNVFGVGENPTKGLGPERTRSQLAAVFYEHEEGNGKTPRKMVVLVPKVEKDVAVEWKPMRREEHLVQQFESGRMEKMTVLRNKAPSWNSALNAYVLNFFGRVTMPSVKNFQLINPEDGCVQCLTL
eukprot:TRINITY_DN1313_c0_g3_i5.p2 TRINITY_DN1313_c0_g3~~TRINITY_DN1313_c0_g3_i5.p2  ORF type:complete len:184 (-),score=60.73 TRINITY_DN1313_c0_g3_i5:325-876(-)